MVEKFKSYDCGVLFTEIILVGTSRLGTQVQRLQIHNLIKPLIPSRQLYHLSMYSPPYLVPIRLVKWKWVYAIFRALVWGLIWCKYQSTENCFAYVHEITSVQIAMPPSVLKPLTNTDHKRKSTIIPTSLYIELDNDKNILHLVT